VTTLVFDAGALIAFERGDRRVGLMAELTRRDKRETIVVPAGVIGQVWRNGARQARLAALLSSRGVIIEALDDAAAREAGQLCGLRSTTDVIDASVALAAIRRDAAVVTSDPDDIARLDPTLRIISI
jgi:predicted nucleic acid-binding protein